MSESGMHKLQRRSIGETGIDFPNDDLDPAGRGIAKLIWAAVFGGLGVVGAVWGITQAMRGEPGLLVGVLGFTLIALGLLSGLGRFVKTPA
ncbi:hypothetical protein [Bradymonas sediminis]|nr:hypothetical protein [Bradymonas sediminis]TDP75437.1 hypothetical protein DFR33_104305 [Bradymonas sediminis]